MISVLGKNSTLDQVMNTPLRIPEGAGKYWKGIPHGELLDSIFDEVGRRGWTVGGHEFWLGRGGAVLVGGVDLRLPEMDLPEGQELALGIVTSNDRSQAVRMYAGSTVTVCSNGMVSGEIVLQRRHTKGFDLREELGLALDDYVFASNRLGRLTERLRERELGEAEYEHLLVEAGRAGIMPWSRLGRVDLEYRRPRFGEIGTGTSWALLNAFTWVAKANPPREQMEQINRFRASLPLATAG